MGAHPAPPVRCGRGADRPGRGLQHGRAAVRCRAHPRARATGRAGRRLPCPDLAVRTGAPKPARRRPLPARRWRPHEAPAHRRHARHQPRGRRDPHRHPRTGTPWSAGSLLAGPTGQPRLLFGRMYEDPAVELAAFPSGARVLCIASAGDTAAALAAAGHEVTALDLNPAQLAYARARLEGGAPALTGTAERLTAAGRRTAGTLLPAWRPDALERFLRLDDPAEQRRHWDSVLNGPGLRLLAAPGCAPPGPSPPRCARASAASSRAASTPCCCTGSRGRCPATPTPRTIGPGGCCSAASAPAPPRCWTPAATPSGWCSVRSWNIWSAPRRTRTTR
ncbi:DUF3419 family protein [Kitasatospora gansuensis]